MDSRFAKRHSLKECARFDLHRRGFDSYHIFSVDEYYWEDRAAYHAALEQVRLAGKDLTKWLEYSAQGLKQTLERVWLRLQSFQRSDLKKNHLEPQTRDVVGIAPRPRQSDPR